MYFRQLPRLFLFLIVSGGMIYAALAMEREESGTAMPLKTREPLTIFTPRGKHAFKVEVVKDGEEMRRGLMFREEVPPKTGMLFNFRQQRRISMWMKNTLVPLDMLFINKQGTIIDITENTTPFSLTPIISKHPALAVLEVRAGTCNEYGISLGDRVEHPLFEVTAP